MPQQIIVSGNGGTQITPVGPVGPPGSPGPPGPPGVAGDLGPINGSTGLLSAIPVASTVPDGYRYRATDELVTYVKSGAVGGGSWLPEAVQGITWLETIKPTTTSSAVTLTTAATPYGLPGMTSTPFVYNGKNVHAIASNIYLTQSNATDRNISTMLQYTKNAGVNWYGFGGPGAKKSLTDLTLFSLGHVSNTFDIQGVLPCPTLALTIGDTVQVRLAAFRNASTSIDVSLMVNTAFVYCPTLQIFQEG